MENLLEELINGRDLTKQLQILIQKPFTDDVSVSQQKELVNKIFGSLTQAISVMSSGSSEYSGGICQIPATSGDQKPVGSGASFKRPLEVKDQRSDSNRRKYSDSWTKVLSSKGDEYEWRKYGQKKTSGSAFPRCYFRCTHKKEQGCKATKQVQKIQEEPIKYQITYCGQHTCSQPLQPNLENILLDSYPKESNHISFQLYTPNHTYLSTSCPNSVKEENNEVKKSDLTSDEWPSADAINLAPLTHTDIFNNYLQPDSGSYASSIAYHGMDMGFSSEWDDFKNCFHSIIY